MEWRRCATCGEAVEGLGSSENTGLQGWGPPTRALEERLTESRPEALRGLSSTAVSLANGKESPSSAADESPYVTRSTCPHWSPCDSPLTSRPNTLPFAQPENPQRAPSPQSCGSFPKPPTHWLKLTGSGPKSPLAYEGYSHKSPLSAGAPFPNKTVREPRCFSALL